MCNFDFFYLETSQQFLFYRIPKMMFLDALYRDMSTDSKLLYGLMLDRMSLSAKNGWLDNEGRIYIIYTIEEIMYALGCANQKVSKILRELTTRNLIMRKRQGLGRPNLIYVKNFTAILPSSHKDHDSGITNSHLNHDIHDSGIMNPHLNHDIHDSDITNSHLNCGNHDSEDMPPDSNHEKHDSGIVVGMIAESCLAHANKNNTNKTNMSDTDIPSFDSFEEPTWTEITKITNMNECEAMRNDTAQYSTNSPEPVAMDTLEEMQVLVRENIEYHQLVEEMPHEAETITEIADLLADTMYTKRTRIRISREDMSAKIVKRRLAMLGKDHIRYVLDCLAENKTRIRNAKGYLLTTLYNAPLTMSSHIRNEVTYDFAKDSRLDTG